MTGRSSNLEIKSLAQAGALLDEARLGLIRALGEGESAAGLARRLGLPRQRVNYHLRELERAGLVEAVGERRRGNCTERLLRPVARAFVLAPGVLGEGGGSEVAVRFAGEADRRAFMEDAAAELARLAREYEDAAGAVEARVRVWASGDGGAPPAR